jgi:hypothetical protein
MCYPVFNGRGVALSVLGKQIAVYFCFPNATEKIYKCWYDETAAIAIFL